MEKLFIAKEDKDQLSAENMVVLTLWRKISGLKTTTDSLAGSLQEVKGCAAETEKIQ